MANYDAPLYQNKPEVWDEAKCHFMSRHRAKDGLGTAYPWLGYIGNHFGDIRYNGGCERDGQWWQGETRPLPIVAKGYELIVVPTWGWRIRREGLK